MPKIAISVHAKDDFSIDIIKGLVGIDYIHIDVMDGKFVETKNLNLNVFKIVKNHFNIPLIAHMMVQDPLNYLNPIIDYVDYFLFHFEVEENKLSLIKKIKAFNKGAGLALNPKTGISEIRFLLNKIDIVLVLGVNPGWSGQSFIPKTVKKVNDLAKYKENYDFLIDVDGGINLQNAVKMKNADILTSASFILQSEDPNSVIRKLKTLNNSKF